MVTLKEISKKAGTTESTVSLVLNGRKFHRVSTETRQRVEQIAKDLGYIPNRTAQTLAHGKTETIALLVTDLSNWFCSTYTHLLQEVLDPHGYCLFPLETRTQISHEAKLIGWLAQRYFDGAICLEYDWHNCQVYQKLNCRLPLVTRGWKVFDEECSFSRVVVNYEVGIRALFKHLHEIGRCRPGILAEVPPGGLEVDRENPRYRLYAQMIGEFGMDCPKEWWRPVDLVSGLEQAYHQTKVLLSDHPRIDALIVHSAIWIPAVYKAASEMGRKIGRDLAVAGFDNQPICEYFQPGLTVVCEPVELIAQELGRMLLAGISNKDASAETVELNSQLIIRESTAGGRS